MSPRAKKVVTGLAAVAVLAPAFIWWEIHKKSEASAEVKATAGDRMAQLAMDEAGMAYFRELVEAHHEAAFDSAYSMGGRRRSAKFDEGKYYDQLLSLMAAAANRDGRAREAAALQVTRVTLLGEALEGEEPPPAQ